MLATGWSSSVAGAGISLKEDPEAGGLAIVARNSRGARVPNGCKKQGVVDAQQEGAAPLGEEVNSPWDVGAPNWPSHLTMLRQPPSWPAQTVAGTRSAALAKKEP